MPIYVVEPGRRVITPLKVQPKIKQVEELEEISALHPLGIGDEGTTERTAEYYQANQQSALAPTSKQVPSQQPPSPESVPPDALLQAKDIMSAPLIWGQDHWLPIHAAEVMAQHDITHLPVSDGTEVVGLLKESQVLRSLQADPTTQIGDICEAFLVVGSDSTIDQMAIAMLFKSVDAVLIRNNDFNVIGIVTTADYLKLYAQIELETWA